MGFPMVQSEIDGKQAKRWTFLIIQFLKATLKLFSHPFDQSPSRSWSSFFFLDLLPLPTTSLVWILNELNVPVFKNISWVDVLVQFFPSLAVSLPIWDWTVVLHHGVAVSPCFFILFHFFDHEFELLTKELLEHRFNIDSIGINGD